MANRDIPGAFMDAAVWIGDKFEMRPEVIKKIERSLITGSDSPAFVESRWKKARGVIGVHPDQWIHAKADKDAGWRPVTKKHAVVMGLSRVALEACASKNAIPEDNHAVAYFYRGKVGVGILPNGFGLPDGEHFQAGMRQGNEPAVIYMGLWEPDGGQFYAPDGVDKIGDMIPTRQIHSGSGGRYPDTPIT